MNKIFNPVQDSQSLSSLQVIPKSFYKLTVARFDALLQLSALPIIRVKPQFCFKELMFHLFHSMSCLQVGIISCSDGSHGGWLITRVRLCGVFKVGVWTTGTVTVINKHIINSNDTRDITLTTLYFNLQIKKQIGQITDSIN